MQHAGRCPPAYARGACSLFSICSMAVIVAQHAVRAHLVRLAAWLGYFCSAQPAGLAWHHIGSWTRQKQRRQGDRQQRQPQVCTFCTADSDLTSRRCQATGSHFQRLPQAARTTQHWPAHQTQCTKWAQARVAGQHNSAALKFQHWEPHGSPRPDEQCATCKSGFIIGTPPSMIKPTACLRKEVCKMHPLPTTLIRSWPGLSGWPAQGPAMLTSDDKLRNRCQCSPRSTL